MRPSYTFWFWFCLAIVGIVLLYPKFIGNKEKVYFNRNRFDIKAGIKSALGQYQVDTGSYPKSLQDLVQKPDDAKNWHGPYFDPPKLPVDPWGHDYFYECPGKHNQDSYDLLSAGPDGRIGTEDDIVNWQ